MSTSFDIFVKIAKEERKYFENYVEYAKKIKKIAEMLLGEVEVFVFGSVVEGKHTPASDIDILICSKNAPQKMEEKAKIAGKILKEIDVFAPFEIHIVTPEEFEWYRKFLRKTVKV
ncbi:nucleotidyltransferase domain-containing protein [Archaeoglobus sp.]